MLVMLVGAVFIGFRLAPLALRHGMAWGTLWPLWASALSTLFETALLLATPLSLALALMPPTGDASVKSADSPASHWPALGSVGLLLFVAYFGVGAFANARFGNPGRVARSVVQSAREACIDRQGHRVEPVPLIAASWICSPSAPPRLAGEWSKNGTKTHYSARGIELSEDLSHIDLTDFELSAVAASGTPTMRLSAMGARIHGNWPWVKGGRISPIGRAFYATSLAIFTAMVAVALRMRSIRRWRWLGPLIAGVGSAVDWAALAFVDKNPQWFIGSYLLVPVLAMVAMAVTLRLSAVRSPFR